MGDIALITDGLEFPEGPVVLADGSIIVVEIARGTLTRVELDGTTEVVAETGGGPNGAALGPDGAMYVCNNGGFEWNRSGRYLLPGRQADDYAGGSIQRVDIGTGEVETLYTHVDGHRLCGPNDLMFDATGGFWFSDHGKIRERDRDRGGLYYAAADGSEIREVAFPLDGPNGVGISPGGDRVYVAETQSGRVLYWNLSGPGQLAEGEQARGRFLAAPAGNKLFDSLAMDADGNVCVATIVESGISTFTPDGAELEFFATDDPLTTNIAFGGDDLGTAYITLSGTGRLIATEWPRAGLALPF
jgi:gluconolactonase